MEVKNKNWLLANEQLIAVINIPVDRNSLHTLNHEHTHINKPRSNPKVITAGYDMCIKDCVQLFSLASSLLDVYVHQD